MSHYNHTKRHYNANPPRWHNNNYNNKNWTPRNRRGRGRGRGHRNRNRNRGRGRGRGLGRGRGRNWHNRRTYNTHDNNFPFTTDISRMKLDKNDNLLNKCDRYAPGGSECENLGTATPASIRYMKYQTYSATASPVYGLSQYEAPNIASYNEIESKYKQYLHELNIDDEYPRLKYYIRAECDKKNVIHFGQLKLLLSEIRFLTEYNELGDVVIYAGAAPGHHIQYLSQLFPRLKFELYDPCEFSKKLDNNEKIKYHQQYFTNKLAKELAEKYRNSGENILFISDIRTADHRQMEEIENEQCIERDNKWQKEWVQCMKPKKAMLKFRLPYPDRILGPTEYLDGEIWLQSFARRSGTETRLIPYAGDDCSYSTMRLYSHRQFEENLFFFNEKIRKSYVFNEYYDSSIGFENNFDCWSYGYLLERYLFYVAGIEVDETEDVFKRKKVLEMVENISLALNINVKWLLYKQNKKEDYINNYDMMDHRHFHKLNEKEIETIPLPKKQKRVNRKRTFNEFNCDNIEDNNNQNKNNNYDPIGFIKKIAKPFPNPGAWREKISEMIGDDKKLLINNNDEKNCDENIIDLLFKYLNVKNENKNINENERKDFKVLLCVNRLFAVLCIQIPPNCGFLNDSKFNDIYIMYGLCNVSQIITCILSNEINELYLYGILSHVVDDNIVFKLLKIVGINKDFVARNNCNKYDDTLAKITQKLLSIHANLSFTN